MSGGGVPIRLALAIALAAGLALAPLSARALEGRVDGTIVDGTNGGEGRAESIQLLRLREGMEAAGGVENVTGAFSIPGISAEPDERFLLRVTHDGVAYNRAFGFAESGVNFVEVTVYDTTSSLDDLRVVTYQIGLAAETEALRVFKIWELTVGGGRPRTIVAKPGAFRFPIQSSLLQIRMASARFGTMPLNVDPIPVEGGAGYTIDYPLRPGQTEIQLAYDLPYAEIGTDFAEALIQPVEEMNVLIVPKELEVTSSLLSDRGVNAEDGIRVFSARDLPEGAPIAFRLSGKGAPPSPAGETGGDDASAGASPRVVRVPNRTQKLLLPALVGVLGPLLGGLAYTLVHKPAGAAGGPRRASDPGLLARREAILARIVALDQKHRAGQISEYSYWQKREALKGELVLILEEIDRGSRIAV